MPDFFKRNVYQSELDLADHFGSDPAYSPFSRWFGGMVVPLAILWYAIEIIIAEKAMVGSEPGAVKILGIEAVIWGIGSIGLGSFIHFHYFWTSFYALCDFADLGKLLSLLVFLGAKGYVIWGIFTKWL